MMKPINCKTCGVLFTPKSNKNVFHDRPCFRKDYYHKGKKECVDNFPIFNCPSCGKRIELDFDPKKDQDKWSNFCCSECNVLMICVIDEIVMNESATT